MVGSKINKVIFIGTTPYPNGQAATNRLIGLLNQLPNFGVDTYIFCLASTRYPTDISSKKEFKRKGTFKSVHFEYLSLVVKNPRFKIFRILSGMTGIIFLPFKLLKFGFNKNNIIITNMVQVHYVIYFTILSKIFGYKFVLLRSEFPDHVNKDKKILILIYDFFIKNWFLKGFDGFIFMTYKLSNYYINKNYEKKKLVIIPTTVDVDRFNYSYTSPFDFEYIAYAGSLSITKDGIDILIEAFVKIAALFPRLYLVIIGRKNKLDNLFELEGQINNLSSIIKSRIIFTGFIDRTEIPRYLLNAKVLVLPRPNSIQAEGGFPSKLGEYLSTGKPIVSTKVGEIPLYLKDKENVIFANPNDIESLKNAIIWVLNNPDDAKLIGLKGKSVALNIFSSKIQGKVLEEFLQKIINEN